MYKYGYFRGEKTILKNSSAFGTLFFDKNPFDESALDFFLLPSDQKNGLKKVLTTTTTPFLQAAGNMILKLILCTIKYTSFSGPNTTYIKELFSCLQ